MENKSKNHYRKVLKSDHLGIADLEDLIEEKVILVFTIKEVKQEWNVSVAGKKGNFNIAYFNEPIKPLVLNATNSKVVRNITGSPFVEDWKGVCVELYIDPTVKMKGDVVGGVRLRPGVKVLPELKEGTQAFTNAIKHIKGGGSWDKVEARFSVSEEIKNKVEEACNASI